MKSASILSPISTLLSLFFHIVIISLALVNRRKWPLIALAAFLYLPLVVFLQRKLSRQGLLAVGIAGMLLLGGFTHYSATIWQDFPSMVAASARAQAQYATILFNSQRYEESLRVIDRAIQTIPTDNPLLLVNRMIILCNLGLLDDPEFRRVGSLLSDLTYDVHSMRLYTSLISLVAQDRCPDWSNKRSSRRTCESSQGVRGVSAGRTWCRKCNDNGGIHGNK